MRRYSCCIQMYKLHSGLKLASSRSVEEYEPESERLASTFYVFRLGNDANRPVGGGDIHLDLYLVQEHDCTAYRMEELKTFPLNLWDFRRGVGEVCGFLWLYFVLGFGLTTSENDIFGTG